MSFSDRASREHNPFGPHLALIAIKRLYSGPDPVLRDRIAIGALLGILYTVIIGTKPLRGVAAASSATTDGDPLRQMIYTIIFAAMLWLSQVYRQPKRLLVFPISISIVLLWCVASLSWSIAPQIAVRRLLLTVMLMWTIFRAVDELGYARTLAVLRIALGAALVANFLAVALSPEAIHRTAEFADPKLVGNWRGFLPHKNWAGPLCAVTVLCFLFDGRSLAGARKWARVGVLVGAGFFLFMTQSKTAINVLAPSILAGVLFQRYSPAYRVFVIPVAAVAVMAVAVYVSTNLDSLLSPFWGSDRTVLTGRVDIWPVLMNYAQDHPLGAGFGSFWKVGRTSPIFQYTKTWVADVGNGHNGYLDLLITIGWPGLVLAVIAVVVLPFGRLMMSVRVSRQAGGLLMAMLVFCICQNMTEASLFDRDMLMQVFSMLTLALIHEVCRRGDLPRGRVDLRHRRSDTTPWSEVRRSRESAREYVR